MFENELVHIRAEITPEQREKLDSIAYTRTQAIRDLLDEHAEQLIGHDPDPDVPERVRCERCDSVTIPLFWYDEQVHCRTCVRERVPDFKWPPTDESEDGAG